MTIEEILNELYAVDPGLKQHETKLRALVAELLAAKPEVHINKEFADALRHKLLAEASLKENKQTTNQPFMRKLNFVLSGALTVAIVIAGAQYYTNKTKTTTTEQALQLLSSNVEISPAKREAFGNLNSATPSGTGKGGGGSSGVAMSTGNAVAPANAASSLMAAAPDAAQTKIAVGGGEGAAIVPPYENYKFVYKGGDLPALADQQMVLRRVAASANQGSAAQFIKKFSFGLIDISKFKDPQLQNFTLSENREFGYIINADLTQSSINLYQNWEKWPHPENSCTDEHCYQQYRLKLSEIPSDQEVIAAANSFMSEYGISLSGYGAPMVNSDWKTDYEQSTDKANYYIPDQVTVVYPLVLQDKTVLDESGNPTGIMVNVDARTKKVTNVYGLLNRKYEQSSYAGETDGSKIIKLAENGGWRSYLPYAMEGNTKQVTVELDTPTVELVQVWKYDSNASQELYVPALVFSVKGNSKAQGYLPRKVVVPLVKELLDNNQGGPIHTMDSVAPSTIVAPASPSLKQ